jgi:membrane-bound inhibitor of C-type lysozyme
MKIDFRVVLLLTLAGCAAGVPETVIPDRITYQCGGGKVLPVERSADRRQALVHVEGRALLLARADSAAQERYSNGEYSLYLDGERAMLESTGRVLFGPCISPVPLPTVDRQR